MPNDIAAEVARISYDAPALVNCDVDATTAITLEDVLGRGLWSMGYHQAPHAIAGEMIAAIAALIREKVEEAPKLHVEDDEILLVTPNVRISISDEGLGYALFDGTKWVAGTAVFASDPAKAITEIAAAIRARKEASDG